MKKLPSTERNDTIVWNRFHYGYVTLYRETAKFNGTVRSILFYMETISKSSLIMATIFYSRQKVMGIHNTMAALVILFLFIYTSILYSRVVCMPSYNQQCTIHLSNWLARIQRKRFSNRKIRNICKRVVWQRFIKLNLFFETMMENGFGFTCGQVFLVTKYEFFKLLVMNIPFFILLYKKICSID